MQVNVPYDYLTFPPTEFSENNFPPVNSSLPPQLSALIPKAASTFLNVCFQAGVNNYGRTMACNALSQNNFQNDHYIKSVEFVIRYAVTLAKQANYPYNVVGYINESARAVSTMFTSAIIACNQVLHQVLPPNVIAGAHRNNQHFNNIQSSIWGLDLSNYQNSNQSNSNGWGGNQNNQESQIYNHQYSGQNSSRTNSAAGSWSSSNTAVASSFGGSNTTTAQTNTNGWNNNQSGNQSGSASGWGAQQAPQPVQPQQPAITPPVAIEEIIPVSDNFTTIAPILTVQKGNEMDIDVHSLPYFGETRILLDMDSRRIDFRSDSLTASREGRRDPKNTHDPVILDGTASVELNLDTAIFVARTSHANLPTNVRSGTIFRKFFNILEPVVIGQAATALMKGISEMGTITMLPAVLRKLLSGFKDPCNPSPDELDVLNFATYIDRQVAHYIRDFLIYNLNESDMQFDSYAADSEALFGWIKSQRSEDYLVAVQGFENRLINMIQAGITPESEEMLDIYFTSENKLKYGYVPYTASVTVLTLTNKELGINVAGEGFLVDPKNTPTIHDMVNSISRNKKDVSKPTMVDVVVTADGFKYRVSEHGIKRGSFLIHRMK